MSIGYGGNSLLVLVNVVKIDGLCSDETTGLVSRERL